MVGLNRLWTFVLAKLFDSSLSTQALIVWISGISSTVYFFRSSENFVRVWARSCSGERVNSLVVSILFILNFRILNFLMSKGSIRIE